MKAEIHPDYHQATINCACGSSVVTHSTRGNFSTDVCSACHPFYTGKHKIMDTAGRVDRFRRKYGATAGIPAAPAEAAAETTTEK
jgi:large subunit ribosomal protein L31